MLVGLQPGFEGRERPEAVSAASSVNRGWDLIWPSLMAQTGKESICQCRRRKRQGFDPWVRKVPWRRKWQPTPVFLPGESHGQRSLVGYRPWVTNTLFTFSPLRGLESPMGRHSQWGWLHGPQWAGHMGKVPA